MAFGAVVLLRTVNLLAVAPWVVAPVVLHDLVLGPLIIAVIWLVGRWLPPYARGPGMFGLVVSGSLTVVALSVIGRQGADPNNPSLLNRDYPTGWLVAIALTWGAVVVVALARRAALRRPKVDASTQQH
jgi:hypothetical protein